MPPQPLVVKIFRQPERLTELSLAEWDLLLRQAQRANLTASLRSLFVQRGLLEQVPAPAREHLEWVRVRAERHTQAVHWEIRQIRHALKKIDIPVILLKGAAYVQAQLPAAAGRLFSDIDILVPKARINEVEAALMMHGWAATHHDTYDQRYYRTWMHELPPMQHMRRGSVIDVHHAIVPETARVHPAPEKLRADACAAGDQGDDNGQPLQVLAPVDMVLHSAVHLFYDGEFDHGLRDLVDIHRLLRHFGDTDSFWTKLLARAQELQLVRPLFYALRYSEHMLGTGIPVHIMREIHSGKLKGRPNPVLLAFMDQLFLRALQPTHDSCSDWLTGPARTMLYIRGNWLRMPPLLLAKHLFHKAFISPKDT